MQGRTRMAWELNGSTFRSNDELLIVVFTASAVIAVILMGVADLLNRTMGMCI